MWAWVDWGGGLHEWGNNDEMMLDFLQGSHSEPLFFEPRRNPTGFPPVRPLLQGRKKQKCERPSVFFCFPCSGTARPPGVAEFLDAGAAT